MIQIIAIILFCRSVGRITRAEGRRAIGYQLLTAAMCFAGEFLGGIIGVMIFGFQDNGIDPMVYVAAIIGALAGGVGAIAIVKALPHGGQFETRRRTPVQQGSSSRDVRHPCCLTGGGTSRCNRDIRHRSMPVFSLGGLNRSRISVSSSASAE